MATVQQLAAESAFADQVTTQIAARITAVNAAYAASATPANYANVQQAYADYNVWQPYSVALSNAYNAAYANPTVGAPMPTRPAIPAYVTAQPPTPSPPVPLANNTLIKSALFASEPFTLVTVYLYRNGTKYGIPDYATLSSLGFTQNSPVTVVPVDQYSAIPGGGILPTVNAPFPVVQIVPPPAPTPLPSPAPAPNVPPIPGEGGGGTTTTPAPTPAPGTGPSSGAGLLLTPLPPVTLQNVAPGQTFSTTVGNALGNLGTPADGWDALFAIPAGVIDTDTAGLSDLDTALAAADFVIGDFDSGNIAPLQALLDALTTAGSPFFS